MDVNVLRVCCLKFPEISREIADGRCPFAASTTIAGLCNKFWRMQILKQNQTGLLPSNSSHTQGLPSRKAVQLLSYLSQKLNFNIQHYYNGEEIRVGGLSVDGYYAPEKTVFEFYGCFFHGCQTCFNKTTIQPLRGITMAELYQETMQREERLLQSSLVAKIVGIWEHEYDDMIKNSENFRLFCSSPDSTLPSMPFNLRDAFYGGRTNAFKLYHLVDHNDGEKSFTTMSVANIHRSITPSDILLGIPISFVIILVTLRVTLALFSVKFYH